MTALWLGDPACHQIQLVGGKAANLSRLAADYRVPPGFCVTPDLRMRWVEGGDGIEAKWLSSKADEQAKLQSIPDGLYRMVWNEYQEMAKRCKLAEPAVAVRSSAIDEDGHKSSFAGQYETFLNVKGAEAIAAAVIDCWRSASAERMVSYRQEHNLSAEGAGIAILVQQLVPAEISGVAFSANPVTGIQDEVMINSTWGLGESVVGGKVTPDTLIVDKSTLKVKQTYIGEKGIMTTLSDRGTTDVRVPVSQRKALSLDWDKTSEVAHLALELERKMGWPVDLEFAYHANELFLLQCRPITTV